MEEEDEDGDEEGFLVVSKEEEKCYQMDLSLSVFSQFVETLVG